MVYAMIISVPLIFLTFIFHCLLTLPKSCPCSCIQTPFLQKTVLDIETLEVVNLEDLQAQTDPDLELNLTPTTRSQSTQTDCSCQCSCNTTENWIKLSYHNKVYKRVCIGHQCNICILLRIQYWHALGKIVYAETLLKLRPPFPRSSRFAFPTSKTDADVE